MRRNGENMREIGLSGLDCLFLNSFTIFTTYSSVETSTSFSEIITDSCSSVCHLGIRAHGVDENHCLRMRKFVSM